MVKGYTVFPALLLVFLLYVPGCGNDGGGSVIPSYPAITPTGTPVNLSEIRGFHEVTAAPGTTMAFIMSGTLSGGGTNNLTAVFSTTISEPTTTNGDTLRVRRRTDSITNTRSGQAVFWLSTAYVFSSGYLFREIYDDGLTATPVSQTLLPATAAVGDSGSYITWSYSEGSSETYTWRIDSGSYGDAVLVFSFTQSDSNDNLTVTGEDRYTIKPDGSVSSFALQYYYRNTGVTMTLSGDRAQLPVSLVVTPSNPSITQGSNRQFTATGTYSDGTSRDLTRSVVWSSSTASVASISNVAGSQGLATSLTAGSTTITATLGGLSGTTTLTVAPAVLGGALGSGPEI